MSKKTRTDGETAAAAAPAASFTEQLPAAEPVPPSEAADLLALCAAHGVAPSDEGVRAIRVLRDRIAARVVA